MTWSIIARDPKTDEFGAAVASKFLAVGALCTWGHGQFGVLATQALLNPLHGGRALRLLADGYSATQALAALLAGDDGRDNRQVHIIDAHGSFAQYTGSSCFAWCGSVYGNEVSVAGNRLVGPVVTELTLNAYVSAADRPLAERLIRAMEAGEGAGGDKLGKQSASIRIWRHEEYPILDLRTDDNPEPISELWRLYDLAKTHLIPYTKLFATRANPAGTFAGVELEGVYRNRNS